MSEGTGGIDRLRQWWDRLPARTAVTALGIGVAVLRWLLAIRRDHAAIPFDETAQLAIARTLGGGGHWNMFQVGTWQPGFGTLLAPLHWFFDEPEVIYRVAIGINAVLAGLAAVLLAHIGHELTGRPLKECAVIAAGISLLPGAIVASSFVWSEQLLITLAYGVLWCALVFVRTADVRLALLVTGLANLAYLSHGRGLPMVAFASLVVGSVFIRKWRHGTFAAIGIWTVAGFLAVTAYSRWVFDRVWDEPGDGNTVAATLRRLSDPVAILDAALGQSWYLLVGTLGLIVAAAAWIWRALRTPEMRTNAVLLLAWTLPTMAVSAVFMSGRDFRTDVFVYGRYNEVVLGPLLVVGWIEFVRLARSSGSALTRWSATTVGVLLTTGLAVHLLHGDDLRDGARVSLMTPALIALDSEAATRVTVPTLVVIAVILALVAVARIVSVSSPWFVSAVVLVVAIAALRVGTVTMSFTTRPLTDEQLQEFDSLVPDDETIVLVVLPDPASPFISPTPQQTRLSYLQSEFPERTFDVSYDLNGVGATYVFAPTIVFARIDETAVELWDDPRVPMSLWRVGG